MNFSREFDKLGHDLASAQARIFARASRDGVSTYGFIKVFCHLPSVESLDDLTFPYGVLSEEDIFYEALRKVTPKKRGAVYEEAVAHWIGYFYRAYCYLTASRSKEAFRLIPPSYLVKVYSPYHSLDIAKAVQLVINDRAIVFPSPKQKIMAILKATMW